MQQSNMAPEGVSILNNSVLTLLSSMETKINRLANEVQVHLKEGLNVTELRKLFKKLNCMLNVYKEYVANFANNGNSTDLGFCGDVIIDTELLLKEVDDVLRLEEKLELKSELSSIRNFNTGQEDILVSTRISKQNVRLSAIKLESFGGALDRWGPYWENFQSLAGNNEELNEYSKLAYLKSTLFGQAKKILMDIPTEAHNYILAVKTLKNTYDRRGELSSSLYERLRNLDVASYSTESLRRASTIIFSLVKQIEALDSNMSETYMIPLILSKLPKPFRLKLEESKMKQEWSFELLEDTIEILIVARERANIEEKYTVSPSYAQRIKPISYPKITTSRSKEKAKQLNCAFCYGEHFSDECKRYSSTKARSEKIGNNCKICLKFHPTKNCFRKKPCYHCKSLEHHRSLCPRGPQPHHNKALTIYDVETNSIQENANMQLYTTKSQNDIPSAIIPTFKAVLVNPKAKSLSIKANIVLDTGSACSYIRDDILEKLEIRPPTQSKITVSMFGSNKSKSIRSSTANVGITKQNGELFQLKVRTVPTISSNIKVPNFEKLSAEIACWEKIC